MTQKVSEEIYFFKYL